MNIKQGKEDMALNMLNISDNLKKRIISSVILLPIAISIVLLGGVIYNMFMLVIAVLMAFEWCNLTKRDNDIYGVSSANRWIVVGIVYIVSGILSMIYLRDLESGQINILFVLFTVWATDISAYFVGRTIGGPKIWPAISPKKTWSGLVGGMLAAGLVNVVIGLFYNHPIYIMMLFGAFLAVISQVGDFFESWVKRHFNVKDSGTILPGHGGVLDRVDGLVTVAPLVAIVTFMNNGIMPLW